MSVKAPMGRDEAIMPSSSSSTRSRDILVRSACCTCGPGGAGRRQVSKRSGQASLVGAPSRSYRSADLHIIDACSHAPHAGDPHGHPHALLVVLQHRGVRICFSRWPVGRSGELAPIVLDQGIAILLLLLLGEAGSDKVAEILAPTQSSERAYSSYPFLHGAHR